METLGVFWTFWGSVHRTVIVGSPHHGLRTVQGFVCDRAHDVWGFRPNLNMKRFSGKVHVHVVCYSACGLDTKPPVICVHLRPPCPSSLSISVISKVQHWSLTYASYWRLNTPPSPTACPDHKHDLAAALCLSIKLPVVERTQEQLQNAINANACVPFWSRSFLKTLMLTDS